MINLGELLTNILPDILTFLVGLFVGILPRYIKTKYEKSVLEYEFSSKLAAELNLTRDELLESFQQLRQERQWKEKWERKYGILIGYMVDTVKHMRTHGVEPLPVPKDLESDPAIAKIVFRKERADEL